MHTLSEFVFCPRAGVIAYQNQAMDEVDVPPPRFNLDYLPDYSVALIEEALRHQLRALWRIGLQLLAVFAMTVMIFFWGWLIGLAASAGLLIAVGWRLADRLDKVLVLAARRRLAMQALSREPVQQSEQMQRVNWWELLRAGYESEVDELVLEDDSLAIAGRPWRILKKGSLRIPVVKASTPEGRDLPVPKAQHCTRIAAYCRLIEKNVGAKSPFGIVIFGSTYEGWTVPNTEKMQSELESVVGMAKEQLLKVEEHGFADEPQSTSICAGCPHGEPVLADSQQIGGPKLRGVTSQTNGKLYHSTCGEMFGWTPPHRAAQKLRLRGS